MSKQPVYLFYGSDSAALKAKLAAWTERFAAQSDAMFDSADLDGSVVAWQDIHQAVQLLPLFGGKRLVVLRDLITQGKKPVHDQLIEFLPRLSDSTVLVLVEYGEVDQRSALLKAIAQSGTLYHFPLPTPGSMAKQLRDLLTHHGLNIEPTATATIMQRVGTDSQSLNHEVEKLRLYAAGQPITKAMVEELVPEHFESRIFQLTDAICEGKEEQAAQLVLAELRYGTAALQIVALLISQVRKLIILADARKRKTKPEEIAALLKVPPFVLSKLRAMAEKRGMDQLVQYYGRLVQADYGLKQGAEAEATVLSLVEFVPHSVIPA